MTMYDSLETVKAELAKCMKCGNCQEVCPIYLEERKEGTVARGKIKLVEAVLKGDLKYTDGFAEKLALCLTCKACNAKCPCGVKVDKIILGTRAAIVKNKGLHPLKKFIFGTLKRPGLFNFGLKTGSVFQGLVFKKHKSLNGSYPRFPFGLDLKRIIPPLASTPLRDQLPEVVKVDNPVKKVAFFTGCTMNYLYVDAGKAVVNILKRNNVEIVIPKDQHCCSMPIIAHGDAETAKEMAKSHVDIFGKLDVDAIITTCGSCGCTFGHHYQELLEDDPEYYEKAKAIAAKIIDISDFIVKEIGLDKVKLGPVNMKVTYHDPCHLNRGMGVKDSPREILKAIPGLEFVEMKNADRCCGSAGSFSLTHYDLSMDIHKHKTEAIKATGADAIVTGCGSCIMQITDGMNRFDLNLPIYYTVEILAKSYAAKEAEDKKVAS
ncbi:MAG: glycolate oxidase iron-sulfur subunit [Clostridia bacterium]|jgi:glycolate oxidase iron-sulfur subunit|nr:glycolate oxidase iron-sulfur subunit [Clostridia bacterium]MDN5322895.1 glycolate oxidase iron-sulfur subunit [Clostridia bacterium]